ncbi:MAG: hypothetical protein ABI679_13800 [Gemmatimonadota bacterium]
MAAEQPGPLFPGLAVLFLSSHRSRLENFRFLLLLAFFAVWLGMFPHFVSVSRIIILKKEFLGYVSRGLWLSRVLKLPALLGIESSKCGPCIFSHRMLLWRVG